MYLCYPSTDIFGRQTHLSSHTDQVQILQQYGTSLLEWMAEASSEVCWPSQGFLALHHHLGHSWTKRCRAGGRYHCQHVWKIWDSPSSEISRFISSYHFFPNFLIKKIMHRVCWTCVYGQTENRTETRRPRLRTKQQFMMDSRWLGFLNWPSNTERDTCQKWTGLTGLRLGTEIFIFMEQFAMSCILRNNNWNFITLLTSSPSITVKYEYYVHLLTKKKLVIIKENQEVKWSTIW